MLSVTGIIRAGLGTPYRDGPEAQARMVEGAVAHEEIALSIMRKEAMGPYGRLALEVVGKLVKDAALVTERSMYQYVAGIGQVVGHPDAVAWPKDDLGDIADTPHIIEWKTTSYINSPHPPLIWAAQLGAYRAALGCPGRQWVVRLTDSEYRISELDSHYIAQCWEHACTAYRLALASDEEAS